VRFPAPLVPARLIRRYKRFLADIAFTGAEPITAYCPNPGSMIGLSAPGAEVMKEFGIDAQHVIDAARSLS